MELTRRFLPVFPMVADPRGSTEDGKACKSRFVPVNFISVRKNSVTLSHWRFQRGGDALESATVQLWLLMWLTPTEEDEPAV